MRSVCGTLLKAMLMSIVDKSVLCAGYEVLRPSSVVSLCEVRSLVVNERT